MSNPEIQSLRLVAQRLRCRITEAERELDRLDRLIGQYAANNPDTECASVAQIRAFAIAFLADGPRHRRDIVEAMQSSGMRINGKDPSASVGSICSRFHRDFVSHGNGIWGGKNATS